MRHVRRRRSILIAGVSMLVALLPGIALATPLPAESCENVSGTAVVQGVPTPTGFELFTLGVTGPLDAVPIGWHVGTLTYEKITPGGMVFMTGEHYLLIEGIGPFTTSDRLVLTPSGQINSVSTIVEGATGTYHAHGALDFSTGIAEVSYFLRICTE